jgi:lysyl-tRNA synthetase class 2
LPPDPHQARRDKLQRIAQLGLDPWGGRFDDHTPIAKLRERISEVHFQTVAGEALSLPTRDDQEEFRAWVKSHSPGEFTGPEVRAAGRIMLQRTGGNLNWLTIQDWTGRIQIMLGKKQVGPEAWQLAQCLDLGDLVGIDGRLICSNTGEITIAAEKVTFLGKCLELPPEKHHGLADPDAKQRQRYLDMTYNEGVAERFLNRTRIVQSIRSTLATDGFVEIEGPTLHTIAGGAAARPFVTHHNALDMKLYMRIALELHLKRLMVGGFERVYELGRVYRNEGISPRHNPEFTMLEAYRAYGDYRTMMDLTENIICSAIRATGQPLTLEWNGKPVDFTPPFQRKTYNELFAEQTGIDPTDHAAIAKLAESLGFDTAGRHPDVIKSDVFEEKVEDALIGPIFVIDYPASICPLTKRKTSDPSVAERFELFVHGMELANAYTELNDPDLQEELFRTQLAGQNDEDSMAKMDDDFIRALRYGMPPAGGLGIGIDRLVMLITGSPSIRDVILFPILREAANVVGSNKIEA